MCRQGRRFSKEAQTPRQCPSSSTSCGFFEFSVVDTKLGTPKTGVYDCVDNGILRDIQDDDYEQEGEPSKYSDNPTPFAEMCGAVPKCQVFPIDHLRRAFVKYLVQEYDIKLEGLSVTEIRFCCAMFHSTVQKLVTSPTYQLPQVDAPPVSCQGETCGAGAVGCLLHAIHDGDDYGDDEEEEEEYEDQHETLRLKSGLALNDYIEDDDYVNAVELSFDDLDIELITREPPVETTTLPSLRLPMNLEDLTTTKPMTTTTTTTTTQVPKTIQKIVSSKKYDSYEDEVEPLQSTHCVYRHLNNEYYRYCLLVHQSRDGDRCYHHKSQTICCCFVGPDKETCDPTEMDLIVPPPVVMSPSTTRVLITTSTSTTTSTTTTTTSTTTATPTTEMIRSTHAPLPPQVYRPRPIDQTKRKQNRRKCRVTYVRTKSGQRTRPVLVCDSVSRSTIYTPFILLFFYWSLF